MPRAARERDANADANVESKVFFVSFLPRGRGRGRIFVFVPIRIRGRDVRKEKNCGNLSLDGRRQVDMSLY